MRTRDDPKGQAGRPSGAPEVSRTAAAGGPSVEQDISGRFMEVVDTPEGFPISQEVLRKNGISVFRVKGNCMRDDDLSDGDYVIMERLRIPAEGDLVVAATGAGEPRLKRFCRDTQGARLESANPSKQDVVPEETAADILGVVVGILRKYTS